jgi:hypothetical protein
MWCGSVIGWNTRRDAKYCKSACRQAYHRFRTKYGDPFEETSPAVRDRALTDANEFPEFPSLHAGRPVYWGTCTAPAKCLKCRARIVSGTEVMVLGPGSYFSGEAGPFCDDDCLLDFVFSRPPE